MTVIGIGFRLIWIIMQISELANNSILQFLNLHLNPLDHMKA